MSNSKLIKRKQVFRNLTVKDEALIKSYNATDSHIKQSTLHDLFIAQAGKTPGNPAVFFKEEMISYSELDRKSDIVASGLKERGAEPGDYIALHTRRCPGTIINMLGILKAGSAFVPVDPEYPEERKKYIMDNSNCQFILEPDYHREVESCTPLNMNPPSFHDCQSDAYIIYTSGSTGQPKGVIIQHGPVTNTIIDINRKFGVNENDRIIGISSMCFDLSVYDIFGALSTGAALVMVENQRDITNIIKTLKDYNITIWNTVPTIMDLTVDMMLDHPHSDQNQNLRLVILSGDWINLKLPEKIGQVFNKAEIVSGGGATEVSVWSIYWPVSEIPPEWKSIPYGIPLANQTIHVLDEEMNCQPPGIPGEIYIGGAGLARGYRNDPEKTKAAFIDHNELGRLYRTGDFGKMRNEGYVEFLGRRDSQVKIRGFRIELGEIENKILELESIKGVVVTVRTDEEQNKFICAYLVPHGGPEGVREDEVRNFLLSELPGYMVPPVLIFMEKFPLSPNGKIDRNNLPAPDNRIMLDDLTYTPPRSRDEECLASIWAEVFGVKRVGIKDSYFALGGDSLKANRIISLAQKAGIKLSISDLYELTSIERIFDHHENSDRPPSGGTNYFEAVEKKYFKKDMKTMIRSRGEDLLFSEEEIPFPGSKKLKIEVQDKITTYLHRSLPLCVILSFNKYRNWFYQNFIQIFSHTGEEGFVEINYLEERDCFVNITDVVTLGYHLLKYEKSILHFIIEKINMGFFVIVNVDEFFLENKWDYQKNHFVHPSLVYGYDRDKEEIYAIGFDRARQFTKLIFSFDMFYKAFEMGKKYYRDYAPWCAWAAVQIIRPKTFNGGYPFSKKRFIRELESYLLGIDDGTRLYNFEYLEKDTAYGVNVYDVILNKLQGLQSGELSIDYRAFHLLSEHKKGLRERLDFFQEISGGIEGLPGLINDYIVIEKKANEVRLKFLEQSFIRSGDNSLPEGFKKMVSLIAEVIKEIRKLETDVLSEILILLQEHKK